MVERAFVLSSGSSGNSISYLLKWQREAAKVLAGNFGAPLFEEDTDVTLHWATESNVPLAYAVTRQVPVCRPAAPESLH